MAIATFSWWALAEGDASSWGLGAVAVLGATGVSLVLAAPRNAPPISGWTLLRFVGYFLVHSTRAGTQVAVLSLRPRLPLAPACVKLPLMLPAGGARTLLLYSITLMPGSLSVSAQGSTLVLHVLDRRLPHLAAVRELEQRIGAIWRLPP